MSTFRMYAAPFRDRETRLTHAILSGRERPKRRQHTYMVCGAPIGSMQRLSANGRRVPTTCEACTDRIAAFLELRGDR